MAARPRVRRLSHQVRKARQRQKWEAMNNLVAEQKERLRLLSDAFDLDTELGARLVAIAPCLDAQLKAKQEGKIARSSSGLVNRDVHVLGGAAKHNFEIDNFKELTPNNARSMQRCQLKKDVSGEQQNCGKLDFRRIDCPSCHLAIWQTIAADHDKEVEEPIHGKLEGGKVEVGQVTIEQLQVVEDGGELPAAASRELDGPKVEVGEVAVEKSEVDADTLKKNGRCGAHQGRWRWEGETRFFGGDPEDIDVVPPAEAFQDVLTPGGKTEDSILEKQSEGGNSGESKEGVGFGKILHGAKHEDIFDKRKVDDKGEDMVVEKLEAEVINFVEQKVDRKADDILGKLQGTKHDAIKKGCRSRQKEMKSVAMQRAELLVVVLLALKKLTVQAKLVEMQKAVLLVMGLPALEKLTKMLKAVLLMKRATPKE